MIKKFISIFLIISFLFTTSISVKSADYLPYAFPFIGKWDATSTPLLIDDYGLQDIQNVRKVGKQFRGVMGHTAINTTKLSSYPYILNGFHFKKDQPQESHIIVYAADSSTNYTASVLYQNTNTIPTTGDFLTTVLHTNSSVTDIGRFVSAPRGNMVYCNGDETLIWGGDEIEATAFVVSETSVASTSTIFTSPNDYSEQIQNTLQTSDQIVTINNGNYWLVGFYRPVQGVKYYINTANASNSSMRAWGWNGTNWNMLSITTDGTSANNKTLAQTGKVSFSSTVSSSKPRYINGLSLYWYMFYATGGSSKIYYCTVDAPMQSIKNVWDGVQIKPARVMVNGGTGYQDYTDQVIDDDETTYAVISSLSSAGNMVAGFTEPQQAIEIRMVAGAENTNDAILNLGYQGLGEWTLVPSYSDGTMNGDHVFGKSGVVSFQSVDRSKEFKRPISDEVPLYYYAMSVSAQLSSSVKVAEIRGVPNPPILATYKFAETFKNRLFLFNDKSGKRNKAIYSGVNTPDIFNGTDSGELTFGDNTDLTASAIVYNVFQNNAVEQMIITKKNETWRLSGDSPDTWVVNKISSNIGCIAPLTMTKVDTTDTGQDIQRQVVVWMSDKGVFMTDGAVIIPISNDIKCYFDPDDSRYISPSMQSKSVAWYDPSISSYKLLVASGVGATYLNTELEYSLKYKEWTKIYRENSSGANPIQSAWNVYDTNGVSYTYGGGRIGDVYRLENGYKWEDTPITQYIHTKDIILDTERPLFRKTTAKYLIFSFTKGGTASSYIDNEDSLQLTDESGIHLITEGNSIKIFHYGDSGDATVSKVNNQIIPNYISLANNYYDFESVNLGPYLYHSFKIQQTTSKIYGLQLTGLGIYYEPFTAIR